MNGRLVAGGRRRVVAVAAGLVLAATALAGCGGGAPASTRPGGTGSAGLIHAGTPSGTVPISGTTLPPSRDNDTGWARVPDATPDADADANQR